MSELLVLCLLFLADFTLTVSGITAYTLLLFPPYLFVRNYSPWVILYGGGVAVFLSEVIHQQTLGSFMLGTGIAVLIFHFFVEVINWQHLWPRAVCLVLYLLIVLLVRMVLIRVVHETWTYPPVGAFLMTAGVGIGLIAYRLKVTSAGGTESPENNAV